MPKREQIKASLKRSAAVRKSASRVGGVHTKTPRTPSTRTIGREGMAKPTPRTPKIQGVSTPNTKSIGASVRRAWSRSRPVKIGQKRR